MTTFKDNRGRIIPSFGEISPSKKGQIYGNLRWLGMNNYSNYPKEGVHFSEEDESHEHENSNEQCCATSQHRAVSLVIDHLNPLLEQWLSSTKVQCVNISQNPLKALYKTSNLSDFLHLAPLGNVTTAVVKQPADNYSSLFAHTARILSAMASIRSDALLLLAKVENSIQDDPRLQPLAVQLKQALGVVADAPEKQPAVAEPSAIEPVPVERGAGARSRGIQYMANEYKKVENLTLEDASIACGISDRVLNEKRQKGEVYALLPYGKTRGYRYPSWQFRADAQRLAAALAPFCKANVSAWVIHNFMMRSHPVLDGERACDYVCDATKPIDKLIGAIDDSLPSDQGAS